MKKIKVEVKGLNARVLSYGAMGYDIEKNQLEDLRLYAKTGKFEHLGDFLNTTTSKRTEYAHLVISELLWAFDKKHTTKIELKENSKRGEKK